MNISLLVLSQVVGGIGMRCLHRHIGLHVRGGLCFLKHLIVLSNWWLRMVLAIDIERCDPFALSDFYTQPFEGHLLDCGFLFRIDLIDHD